MEKKIENKLIMLKATLMLMEQNQAVWQETTPLVNAISQTNGLLGQIEAIKQVVGQNNSGLVDVKENLKEELIAMAFEFSSILAAYAAQTNDAFLKKKVNFPISHFQNMRDGELATACRTLLTLLSENLSGIESYGLAAQQVEALGEMTEQYETNLPSVRVNVSARKVANEKIKELVKEAMKLTEEQTDRLIVKFKKTNADFYNGYLNARKIVDYGTRYKKEEGGEPSVNPNPEN